MICTDPLMSALEVIRAYSKRWAVEPLFYALKHHWGLNVAWEQSRNVLIRWVTILAAGYAINQMLAYTDPVLIGDLARPAPWRHKGEITAGIIRSSLDRLLRQVNVIGLVTMKSAQFGADNPPAVGPNDTAAREAA